MNSIVETTPPVSSVPALRASGHSSGAMPTAWFQEMAFGRHRSDTIEPTLITTDAVFSGHLREALLVAPQQEPAFGISVVIRTNDARGQAGPLDWQGGQPGVKMTRWLGTPILSLAVLISMHGAGSAADLPGARDPAFLKRFQGSEIIAYVAKPYEKLMFVDVWGDPQPSRSVEGEVTRLLYRVPTGHTALEVLRNYEQTARDLGLVQDVELGCDERHARTPYFLFSELSFGEGMRDPYGDHAQIDQLIDTPSCYFSAKGNVADKSVAMQVVVVEKHKVLNPSNGPGGKPWSFKNGEIVVGVDLVTAKALQNQMVVVKAADIADALNSKGVIDLYGVYFDTDKIVVKPESTAALDEVAGLLKIDRSLKLEISGHTDNSGDKAHNLALSQGRADAVKGVLVSKYGIAASRLIAKGYGDTKPVAANTTDSGKAKNRRVELRKL